jgi:hypothetical protein
VVRVVLIDGPLAPDAPGVEARIVLREAEPVGPAALHASALAVAIRQGLPDARLFNIVVFGASLATDAGCVARALDHAVALRPDIVLCAFGMLRRDDAVAAAAERVLRCDALIVAAAPARGGAVYPAMLSGVVAVQGDARCGGCEWSLLGSHPLFGASPMIPGHAAVRGASAAAGSFAGLLAGCLVACGRGTTIEEMKSNARYIGRERRGGAGEPPPCLPHGAEDDRRRFDARVDGVSLVKRH